MDVVKSFNSIISFLSSLALVTLRDLPGIPSNLFVFHSAHFINSVQPSLLEYSSTHDWKKKKHLDNAGIQRIGDDYSSRNEASQQLRWHSLWTGLPALQNGHILEMLGAVVTFLRRWRWNLVGSLIYWWSSSTITGHNCHPGLLSHQPNKQAKHWKITGNSNQRVLGIWGLDQIWISKRTMKWDRWNGTN